MTRFCKVMVIWAVGSLLAAGAVFAASDLEDLKMADDITKETIVGPGSVQVNTGKDILMSFGATVRVIPTSETNWDFGLSENVDGFLFLPVNPGEGFPFPSGFGFRLGKNFFKDHVNEAGWVNNGYIRNEDKLYFNAMPKDRQWSFYAALEYDRPWDTNSVDSRGGKTNDNSNFGLERLNATFALPFNTRFHAGFDIWHLDVIEGAGMVYGDDNPGFWLTGDYETIGFNVGYFKLGENDFQNDIATLNNESDDDRDLYAGYLTWKVDDSNQFKFFYAFDRIRSVSTKDFMGALSNGAVGIATGKTPDVDSHHIGGFYIGNFGGIELFLEGAYQFGTADKTGLSAFGHEEDYDIKAYALAADVSFEFKGLLTGFPLKPHLGVLYTSGDDDPDDDELNGYNGVENAQRFSQRWGGENTIMGDTNLVMGTILYGYIPELYGNGTPVFTGGLQNTSGLGGGRGDNPGLTMISAGLTVAPKRFLIYKTNANLFYWNEDFEVTNFVNPLTATFQPNTTKVDSGYAGTEWDNEVTLALSQHSFIKGQASFLFPGTGIKDATKALGAESDDTAVRLAAEFIWNF